jgi:hypothetical protein
MIKKMTPPTTKLPPTTRFPKPKMISPAFAWSKICRVADISIPNLNNVVINRIDGKEEMFVALGMYIETMRRDKETVMLIAIKTSKPSGGMGIIIIMKIITTNIARTISLDWDTNLRTELLPKEGRSLDR